MLWIILFVIIPIIVINFVNTTYIECKALGIVSFLLAIITLTATLANPTFRCTYEGEKSTYNITGFSESTLHENKSNADDIMCYSYVIDGEEYKIDTESDDIYSIECTKSQPSTVTIQKNIYRSKDTFFKKEMYCYTFE